LLEKEGMRIAPLEVAKYYSHEKMIPEVAGITPFAFHKWEGTNAIYPNFIKESFTNKCKNIVRNIRRTIVNGL
jgi:hypothetical protein